MYSIFKAQFTQNARATVVYLLYLFIENICFAHAYGFMPQLSAPKMKGLFYLWLQTHNLRSLLPVHIPSRSLRSVSEQCLVVPSQRGTTFLFTVSCQWNDLPNPIKNAESNTIFKRKLNIITHLFHQPLMAYYLKKKKTLCFQFFLIPLCYSLYYSKQCLEPCIISTSCVYLPLYDESLIISLWIKASAKKINVNV